MCENNLFKVIVMYVQLTRTYRHCILSKWLCYEQLTLLNYTQWNQFLNIFCVAFFKENVFIYNIDFQLMHVGQFFHLSNTLHTL